MLPCSSADMGCVTVYHVVQRIWAVLPCSSADMGLCYFVVQRIWAALPCSSTDMGYVTV